MRVAEIEKGEREFIFHIATTLEQSHNRNTKLGGLPERHLAHQSWPPRESMECCRLWREGPIAGVGFLERDS